jgi:hypothetical protein
LQVAEKKEKKCKKKKYASNKEPIISPRVPLDVTEIERLLTEGAGPLGEKAKEILKNYKKNSCMTKSGVRRKVEWRSALIIAGDLTSLLRPISVKDIVLGGGHHEHRNKGVSAHWINTLLNAQKNLLNINLYKDIIDLVMLERRYDPPLPVELTIRKSCEISSKNDRVGSPWTDALSPMDMVFDSVDQNQNIILQGQPGCGKTTIARSIVSQLCRGVKNGHRGIVPVYVECKKFIGMSGTFSGRLSQYIANNWNLEVPAERLTSAPEGGKQWLLVFDGLDEVPDPDIRNQLVRQINQHASVDCCACIVMRPVLISEEANKGFQRYFVSAFSEEQASELVDSWIDCFAFSADSNRLAQIKEHLKSPPMRGIVDSPVLLTIAILTCLRDNLSSDENIVAPISKLEIMRKFLSASESRERERFARELFERDVSEDLGSTFAASRLYDNFIRINDVILFYCAWYVQIKGSEDGLLLSLSRHLLSLQLIESLPQIVPDTTMLPKIIEKFLQTRGCFHVLDNARVCFIHNTVREFIIGATLANKYYKHKNCLAIANRRTIANNWMDIRWREPVTYFYLTLLDNSKPNHILQRDIINHLLQISKRGEHGAIFCAWLLASGLNVEIEQEDELLLEFFKVLSNWNPCAKLFWYFRYPDPTEVLISLKNFNQVQDLISAYLKNDEKCSEAHKRFFENSLDTGLYINASNANKANHLMELAKTAPSSRLRLSAAYALVNIVSLDKILTLYTDLILSNISDGVRIDLISFLRNKQAFQNLERLSRSAKLGDVVLFYIKLILYENSKNDAALQQLSKALPEIRSELSKYGYEQVRKLLWNSADVVMASKSHQELSWCVFLGLYSDAWTAEWLKIPSMENLFREISELYPDTEVDGFIEFVNASLQQNSILKRTDYSFIANWLNQIKCDPVGGVIYSELLYKDTVLKLKVDCS